MNRTADRESLAGPDKAQRIVGGLLAFGLVGVFVAPAVLASAYKLRAAWVADGSPGAGC